jgi:hypothetical protein
VDVGSDSAQWDRFFAIERFLIGNAIYLPALGNHEGQSQYYFDYFALPTYPDAVPPVPPEQYYRVKYNNTLFIVLSTETTVGGDQRKWLEETLKSAQADPEIYWMVATFHRPPFSTGMHGSEMSVREAWHGLLRDYGVSLVLNGHEHSYEHVFVEGVHYLVMGGGGATLRAFSSDPASWTMYRESVYHLAVFDVDGHELRATVLRRDGSEMDSFILGVRQDGCEEAAECWGLGHSECSGTWLCQNAQCTWTCD